MAALGKLVVTMSANITEFQSAMSKAAYTADSKMKAVANAAKVAGAVIGTALVAGAAGLANEMRKMINSMDELGKAAQKVGMTTESLSSFRYAAELSGISAESLSQSLIKLNKAAAEGNKGLDAMGISAKNADGSLKSTEQLLVEVADKFSKYEDSAAKSALATSVFGRAGAEMIPFLNLGAEGLAKMQKEAEALGIVIGSKASAQAEAFNDNLTRLSMIKKGIVNQITTAMLPSLVALSDALFNSASNTEMFKRLGDLLAGTLKVLASALVIVYGALESVAMGFLSLWRAAEQGIKGNFRAAIAELDKGGKDMVRSMDEAFASLKTIWAEAEKAGQEANKKGGLAAPLVASAEEAEKSRDKIEAVLRNLTGEYDRLRYTKQELVIQELRALGATEQQIQAAVRQLSLIKQLTDAKNAESEATKKIADRNSALIDLSKEYERLVDETSTKQEKILRDQEKLLDLKNRLIAAGYKEEEVNRRIAIAMEQVSKKYDETKKMAVEFGQAISSAFEKALLEGKKLREVLQGMLKDILAIVTRQLVTKPFGDFISSTIEGILNPKNSVIKSLSDQSISVLRSSEELNKSTANAGTVIDSATSNLTARFASSASALGGILRSSFSFLARILNDFLKNAGDLIYKMLTGLGNLLERVLTGLGNLAERILTGLGNFVNSLLTGLGNLLNSFLTGIGNFTNSFLTGMGNLIERLLTGLGNFTQSFLTGMGEVIKNIGTAIGQALSGLGNLLAGAQGVANTGVLGAVVGSIGSTSTSSFGGFFAEGGTLGAGKWGIAGEDGPEIIHGPANITPMKDMGGQNVTVSNVFYLHQPADRRTQQQIAAQAGLGVQRALARNT
jgi:hypothetical protein